MLQQRLRLKTILGEDRRRPGPRPECRGAPRDLLRLLRYRVVGANGRLRPAITDSGRRRDGSRHGLADQSDTAHHANSTALLAQLATRASPAAIRRRCARCARPDDRCRTASHDPPGLRVLGTGRARISGNHPRRGSGAHGPDAALHRTEGTGRRLAPGSARAGCRHPVETASKVGTIQFESFLDEFERKVAASRE
mgnify:CR=1 FL=1